MRLEMITTDSDEEESKKIINRINVMMKECFPVTDYELKINML